MAKLETLSTIFDNKVFKIPDYQRGYSWGKEQLEDFWSDLSNLGEGRFHYIGMLTIEDKGDFFHIIDGQQRVTTIMILLKTLLNNFDDEDLIGEFSKQELVAKYLYRDSSNVVFGYEKDDPSNCFYKQNILELESIEECWAEEKDTLYTMNLADAKKFFEKKLQRYLNSQLKELIRKVIFQLKFNVHELADELDEFVVFETMNNRGKPLSTLELLKNRLIYLTTLLRDIHSDDKDELRKKINETWKNIYHYLGKNPNKPLSDEKFLKDHWKMYPNFQYEKQNANPHRLTLLHTYFTPANVRDGNIDCHCINNYVISLNKSIVEYFYMFNPDLAKDRYSGEVISWLDRLNRVGFYTFQPLVMASLIDDNKNHPELPDLLKYIEHYMFIKHNTMKGANNEIQPFFQRAKELHKYIIDEYPCEDKTYKGEEIDETHKVYRKSLTVITRDLKKQFYANGMSKLFKVKDFINVKEKLFERDSKGLLKGWYGWKGIAYFLYEYELYLKEKEEGELKIEWDSKNTSIEHIYPKSARRECWIEDFGDSDREYSDIVCQSLGNMMLLSKNPEASNKCFEDKRQVYLNDSYSAVDVSKHSSWTPEKVFERTWELLEFMEKRWNILISDEDKHKLIRHETV